MMRARSRRARVICPGLLGSGAIGQAPQSVTGRTLHQDRQVIADPAVDESGPDLFDDRPYRLGRHVLEPTTQSICKPDHGLLFVRMPFHDAPTLWTECRLRAGLIQRLICLRP